MSGEEKGSNRQCDRSVRRDFAAKKPFVVVGKLLSAVVVEAQLEIEPEDF